MTCLLDRLKPVFIFNLILPDDLDYTACVFIINELNPHPNDLLRLSASQYLLIDALCIKAQQVHVT